MRRELTVFIPTTEKEVEVSVKGIDSKGDIILFNFEGNKFAVKVADLQNAADEIKAFQLRNNEIDPRIDAGPVEPTFSGMTSFSFGGDEN